MKQFITVILLSTLIQNVQAGRESGGGSQCIMKLQALTQVMLEALPQIQSLYKAGIVPEDFRETLVKTSFDIEKNLEKDGRPVDAKNFPDVVSPKIILDRDRCDNILQNLDAGLAFLTHEILGLMRKENRLDYSISKNVYLELINITNKIKKPDWKYICTIQRWHYSGYAGFEHLATIDTYNNQIQNTGYLFSRSKKDLDYYSIHFEVSKGPYGILEPQLYYTLSHTPNHRSDKSTVIKRALVSFNNSSDLKNDDYSRKVRIRLLEPSTFSRENDYLEMICYRSL